MLILREINSSASKPHQLSKNRKSNRMAKPNIRFTARPPLRLRCGERRVVTLTVAPRAKGNCKLTIFLNNTKVVFGGGSSEISAEFQCTKKDELREIDLQMVLMGQGAKIFSLRLNAKIENATGEVGEAAILVLLDCKNPMSEDEQTVNFESVPVTEVTTEADDAEEEHGTNEEGDIAVVTVDTDERESDTEPSSDTGTEPEDNTDTTEEPGESNHTGTDEEDTEDANQ